MIQPLLLMSCWNYPCLVRKVRYVYGIRAAKALYLRKYLALPLNQLLQEEDLIVTAFEFHGQL